LFGPQEANCFQYYGPDYELDVRSSNMENANSYEYLEKIKIAVIENLKRTAHVPSVQMQDVPRASMGMSDEQEAEDDDQDEDDNKDVRMTQRQWEKRVERQDEYEDSDDEDMARANGIFKTNGRSRQETSYRPVNKDDDTMEVDSGAATPAEPATETAADNDDTMIDEALAEVLAEVARGDAEKVAAAEQPAEADNAKVDDDGDIDMAEATPAEDKTTEATIKKEEVEGISAAEAEPTKSPVPETANVADAGETSPPKEPTSGSPEAADADAKPAEEGPAPETSDKEAAVADKKSDKAEEEEPKEPKA
jgi:histone deacetylase 1/2